MRRRLSPHSAVGITSDTVAYWRGGEASGAMLDEIDDNDLSKDGSGDAKAPSQYAIPCSNTGSRTIDGTSDGVFSSDVSAVEALTDWCEFEPCTLTMLFVLGAVSGTQTLFESEDRLRVSVTSAGEIQLRWLAITTLDTVTLTTDGAGIEEGRDYFLGVSRRATGTGSLYSFTVAVWDLERGTGFSEELGTGPAPGPGGDTISIGGNAALGSAMTGRVSEVRLEQAALTAEAMRHIALGYAGDVDEASLYRRGRYTVRARAWIVDGDGDWRNLSHLGHGHDFLLAASWGEEVDQPVGDLALTLAREHEGWSLARDVEESPFNRSTSNPELFKPLVDIGRNVRLEEALLPLGYAPRDIEWCVAYRGFVDEIDYSSEAMEVRARDQFGELQDVWIKDEALPITSIERREDGRIQVTTDEAHGLTAGDLFFVTQTSGAYRGGYVAAADGLTSTVVRSVGTIPGTPDPETSGFLSRFASRTYGSGSGTPSEEVIQSIINSNRPSAGWRHGAHELYTPEPSDFAIRTFAQQMDSVAAAIEAISIQRGWVVRYRWDDDRHDFRLTYADPGRGKETPDLTISADEVAEWSQATHSLIDVRNIFAVRYTDRTATPDPIRRLAYRQNQASIDDYGERFAFFREGDESFLQSPTDVERFLDAAEADLSQPKQVFEAVHSYRRHVQLGDLYEYEPNGVLFDGAKELAVVGYQHTLSGDEVSTKIGLGGRPIARQRGWMLLIQAPGVAFIDGYTRTEPE